MSLAVFLEMALPFFLPQNAVRIEVCGEVWRWSARGFGSHALGDVRVLSAGGVSLRTNALCLTTGSGLGCGWHSRLSARSVLSRFPGRILLLPIGLETSLLTVCSS